MRARTRPNRARLRYYPTGTVPAATVFIRYSSLIIASLLVACATPTPTAHCENSLFAIHARHDGGDLDECYLRGDRKVELVFQAEDNAVDGAFSWFSFRVTTIEPTNLELILQFPDSYARFWPKISRDRQTWERLAADAVQVSMCMPIKTPVKT